VPGAEEAIDDYLAIARDAGLDPSQMAIAFCLTRDFMTSVIIGATSMEQLAADIGAADVILSAEVLERIDAVHQLRGNPCP